MQTATLADGKIKIAPRVAVQPGQSVNATPNSATANPANGADNSVTTNTATTGTTTNTATNTVGSLVRLNRDHDAASATFTPPLRRRLQQLHLGLAQQRRQPAEKQLLPAGNRTSRKSRQPIPR